MQQVSLNKNKSNCKKNFSKIILLIFFMRRKKVYYYYYKIFDYNVKFTGELKISYSYAALSLKTR